jgi:hypothetical protein
VTTGENREELGDGGPDKDLTLSKETIEDLDTPNESAGDVVGGRARNTAPSETTCADCGAE